MREGEGQVQGGGALIHLKNSLGAVLKQIQVGVQVLDSALWPHRPADTGEGGGGSWGQSDREATWEWVRDGHQGVLVAQGLGPEVGGGGIPWRSGHPAWPLSEDMAATRHLQAAAPRPVKGVLPQVPPPKG